MRRGGNDKFNRCFISKIIYTGYPVMCPVGPIVGKKSPFAIFVFRDDEAVGRDAIITTVVQQYRLC